MTYQQSNNNKMSNGNFSIIIIVCCFTTCLIGLSNGMQIPSNLLHCYRGNETEPWIGNTFQLFLELIRKIEDANPTSLDIRTLSVNLIHRMRLDGIVRAPGIRETDFVTPYRASGVQIPKFQVLLELISDTPGPIEFERYLTPTEMCQLHRLISSSIEPYVRGDESRVCPLNLTSISQSWMNQNRILDPSNGTTIVVSQSYSRCPLETGVVRSIDYGSFSPGTVIASIAAGLQPQNVRLNEFVSVQNHRSPWEKLETLEDDSKIALNKLLRSMDSVDNTYSAGLAGDLAEICVYQGPFLSTDSIVGLAGYWNDTVFPRTRYIDQQHKGRWEMTDSEILAGIDGIFISQQISSWVHRIRRMRLSQVLDMYYNPRGIPTLAIENANRGGTSVNRKPPSLSSSSSSFLSSRLSMGIPNPTENGQIENNNMQISNKIKHQAIQMLLDDDKFGKFSVSDGVNSACNRKEILKLIDREKMKDETYFLSQILQFTTSSLPVSDTLLRQNCDTAVDKFFEYSETLLDKLLSCHDISPADSYKPTVDLNLILDGSRDSYQQLQLISYIAESIDISTYGSMLTVYHGTRGSKMVNRTQSISTAFQQLKNFTGPYPSSLSLSQSLSSLVFDLNNQTYADQRNGLLVTLSQVVVIFSQSKRITQTDFEDAKRIIDGSLKHFPDLYFVAITDDPSTFVELFGTDSVRKYPEKYKIIQVQNTNIKEFSLDLETHLKSIPKCVVQPFCEHFSINWRRENNISARNFYEDYATPNQELRYKINSYYLINSEEVQIQFQGFAYGELTVCTSRERLFKEPECQNVKEYDNIWFNITNPCPNTNECEHIYFSVMLDRSTVRCTENDCRYPDQVRFVMKHRGMRCETDWDGNSAECLFVNFYNFYILLFFYITRYYYV